MRLAVIEHHSVLSTAVVGDTARDLGAELDVIWGPQNDPMPSSADAHDGLIVMGGAMDAGDDEQCPYFPPLLALIRDYTAAGKPVLGICLGAQLIARAFEAPLRLAGEFEFGFHDIAPTRAVADDPVMNHFTAPLPLFQWHTDHFELPEGAVHLATNGNYPFQAFRMGRATYATQFHFEVDRPVVDEWISHHPDLDGKAPGFAEWLPRQFAAHEENSKAFCRAFTRRWMALAKR